MRHSRIASWISWASSPTYSLEVPLKGILVLTSDTKTPTRSFLTSILYAAHRTRFFATMVATSAPPSKSSGMRFANR